MKLSQFIHDNRELNQPLIEGLIRRGEVATLIGGTKSRKSWLVMDLAISVATGRPFLGKWPTVQGKVKLIDLELHPSVLANRLPVVCAKRGISIAEIDDWIDVECLRGANTDIVKMANRIIDYSQEYSLIIVDPLYRAIPAGTSENDNAQMSRVFSLIDQLAATTNASFVCIHHATKGNQSTAQVTDVGAGAGSMARAVDTHIILRKHEEDNCVILESAVRSWKPVEPACFRWNDCVWDHAPDLDPTKLRDESYAAVIHRWREKKRAEREAKRIAEGYVVPKRYVPAKAIEESLKLLNEKWQSFDMIEFSARGVGLGSKQLKAALKRAVQNRQCLRRYTNKGTEYRMPVVV